MNNKVRFFSNAIVIIACIFAFIVFILYRQTCKHISEICEYKGRETANTIIIDSIDKSIKGCTYDFININRDGENITSIATNSTAVNQVQNSIKSNINKSFNNINDNKVSIPFGTLSGIVFLSGRGPKINIELHQIGAVDTDIKSEFSSAGINQTKHRIWLTVDVELSAILPFKSTDIKVHNDYLISETIIVGNVPDTYLGINRQNS
ncbi:MAG: sporulation protein YunB [Oscillospiraceae bacterium]